MRKREIRQGDIYVVNLDGIESEEKGVRPCICLSCDSLTKNRKNVIIAPITSSETKKDMLNHHTLSQEDYPFFQYPKNTILLECIRDIAKMRLERIMGRINDDELSEILEKLKYNFIDRRAEDG